MTETDAIIAVGRQSLRPDEERLEIPRWSPSQNGGSLMADAVLTRH